MEKNAENNNAVQLKSNLTQQSQNSEVFNKVILKSSMTVLKAIQLCLIPTVKAAAPEQAPPRPPPMKYNDLSMYECPHRIYKNYLENKDDCPGQNEKIFHNLIQPTVAEYRKSISETYTDLSTGLTDLYKELSNDCKEIKADVLAYMRHPDNIGVRVLFVGTSVAAGVRFGRTIPRKVVGAGLGLLLSGAVCFPDETDQTFRTFMFKLGKALVPVYNLYFGTEWELRERVPCTRDLPEIPPPTKPYPACAGAPEGPKKK